MKKKVLIILAIILAAIVLAGVVAYRMYNKPHTNVVNASPAANLTADELYQQFEENDSLAFNQYRDKVLQVGGTVSKVKNAGDTSYLVLLEVPANSMSNIKCSIDPAFNDRAAGLTSGDKVTIKGICSGKNVMEELGMVFLDVELARCVVVE